MQYGRSNVGLGRVEDAWTNCLPYLANGSRVSCPMLKPRSKVGPFFGLSKFWGALFDFYLWSIC